jgi:hypothetical protein
LTGARFVLWPPCLGGQIAYSSSQWHEEPGIQLLVRISSMSAMRRAETLRDDLQEVIDVLDEKVDSLCGHS